MEPLQELSNKSRELRNAIMDNCDSDQNWIDEELGERLLAELRAVSARIRELRLEIDSRGDMYLRVHD